MVRKVAPVPSQLPQPQLVIDTDNYNAMSKKKKNSEASSEFAVAAAFDKNDDDSYSNNIRAHSSAGVHVGMTDETNRLNYNYSDIMKKKYVGQQKKHHEKTNTKVANTINIEGCRYGNSGRVGGRGYSSANCNNTVTATPPPTLSVLPTDTPPQRIGGTNGVVIDKNNNDDVAVTDNNIDRLYRNGGVGEGNNLVTTTATDDAGSIGNVSYNDSLCSSMASGSRCSEIGTSSSIYSLGNSSKRHHHQQQQYPVLYSAIGSLEHANNSSYSKLNKRFMASTREFCKPIGDGSNALLRKQDLTSTEPPQTLLIPPARSQKPHVSERLSSVNAIFSVIDGTTQQQSSSSSGKMQGSEGKINDMKRDEYDDGCENTVKDHQVTDAKIKIENIIKSSEIQLETEGKPSNQQHCRTTFATISSATNTKLTTALKKKSGREKNRKTVSYDPTNVTTTNAGKKKSSSSKNKKNRNGGGTGNGPIEMFRPSSDAYTPRIERKHIEYKTAEARTQHVQQMSSTMGTLQRPNFRDALRRVAMIIHQHIVKIESRFENHHHRFHHQEHDSRRSDIGRGSFVNRSTSTRSYVTTKIRSNNEGLFHESMRKLFHEDSYRTPTYKCIIARIPMARGGMVYGMRKIQVVYAIPTETEIYDFAHQLFDSVQLSSECSIVCLIYVERLMEVANVPLMACTWRPIFMCGLLLASKVWQDLSSWNIEFSSVYPQFSLESINKLELNFLRNVKWDLYISSSSYAKYYFALRSLVEKKDFRQRYNRLVGGVGNVAQAEALKVQERTERVKEKALLQLSQSM